MRSRTSRRRSARPGRASGAASCRLVRARAAAPAPPGSRAPARTCTRPDRGTAVRLTATRADSRPRCRPGKRDCRAATRRSSGSGSCAWSRTHGDEPAPGVNDLASAELVEEHTGAEVALVDVPARTVVEDALLQLVVDLGAFARRVDHDELAADTAALGEKALTLSAVEMTVEEAREHPIEEAVLERQVEAVALDESGVWCFALRLLEHPRRLIEGDDVTVEMPGQEAGSARHVQ